MLGQKLDFKKIKALLLLPFQKQLYSKFAFRLCWTVRNPPNLQSRWIKNFIAKVKILKLSLLHMFKTTLSLKNSKTKSFSLKPNSSFFLLCSLNFKTKNNQAALPLEVNRSTLQHEINQLQPYSMRCFRSLSERQRYLIKLNELRREIKALYQILKISGLTRVLGETQNVD